MNKSGGSIIGQVEDEYTISAEEYPNNENNESNQEENNSINQTLPACILDSDCNDNSSCTTDNCIEGNCSYTPIDSCVPCSLSSQCDDSNACTANVCSDGKCSYPAIPGCTSCGSNLNCEDNNSCTNNICFQGRCMYTSIENCKSCTLDSECDDNEACTTNTCLNGACTFTSISGCKICTLNSQCDDNDSSTTFSCLGGKCTYTKITSCKNNDGYCPSGCNAGNDNDCSYICGNGIREGTEKCDGASLGGATCAGVLGTGYTGTLKCFSGLCTFDTSLCVAPCTCSDDGNICTTDQCVNNVCQHTAISGCCTSASQCNDNNICTTDSCSGNNLCSHSTIASCCISSSQCASEQTCIGNACVASSNPPTVTCGDGSCNGGETCSNCSQDCGTCASYSRIFYVNATTGNDNNNGLSSSTPWKTLSKVNSYTTFKAGDAILFRRGDIWNESLTISSSGSSSSPITYGAYGSGEKPIMNGFTTVTGWTNEGNGIYSKSISTQSMPNILSVDGKDTPIGRWPDTGWLIVDSHSGKTSITDSDLSNSPYNWGGGELVLRTYWWVTDRNKITSQSGNTIYYTSSSDYDAMDGNGYFIQNHKGTLNKVGDWAYAGSKLYIYFGTNDTPSNHIIRLPTLDEFAYLNQKNYITFDNLHITGYNTMAVTIYGSSHITVTNSVLDFIGDTALDCPWWSGSDHPIIENNLINNVNNDGINFRGDATYASIRYNTVQNVGIISGLSGSGDGSGIGIEATGDNSIISYNAIKNIGYNGISFGGANTVISNNVIDTFCMNKDDGAGIYTYEDENLGKQIINNIVMNGVGAAEGTRLSNEFRAHGVYIDGSDNIRISGNSVFDNYGAGIFINTQALNMNIQGNTVYDNAYVGIQIISNMHGGGSIRNMNMQNNIFFAKEASQSVLYFVTTLGDNDVTQIGTVDYNYYARPIDDTNTFITQTSAWDGPTTNRNLASWQSYSGLDSNSKKSPKTITNVNDIRFEYNPASTSKTITLSGNYIDVKGNAYSGTLTLQPYSSIVLIKN